LGQKDPAGAYGGIGDAVLGVFAGAMVRQWRTLLA